MVLQCRSVVILIGTAFYSFSECVILRRVKMLPITFNTTFVNLILGITAKNLGNSYIKFGVMFTTHRWDITLSNLGVHIF